MFLQYLHGIVIYHVTRYTSGRKTVRAAWNLWTIVVTTIIATYAVKAATGVNGTAEVVTSANMEFLCLAKLALLACMRYV